MVKQANMEGVAKNMIMDMLHLKDMDMEHINECSSPLALITQRRLRIDPYKLIPKANVVYKKLQVL